MALFNHLTPFSQERLSGPPGDRHVRRGLDNPVPQEEHERSVAEEERLKMRQDAVTAIVNMHDYREGDVAEAVEFIVAVDPGAAIVQINMFGAIQVSKRGE